MTGLHEMKEDALANPEGIARLVGQAMGTLYGLAASCRPRRVWLNLAPLQRLGWMGTLGA